MIERIHLEIIEALHQTGSLTKAAEQLNLTQSALTHSIRKLEALSGAMIWEKNGRKLELTQAGREVLHTAGLLLPQFRRVQSNLLAYGRGSRGRIRLGVECHPCFEWLVGMIDGFLNNWPDVELDVTRNLRFDGLSALENRSIDMLVTPDYVPRRGFGSKIILNFELKLMVWNKDELATRSWVQPSDLGSRILLTYPIPPHRLDVVTQFLNPAGVQPKEFRHVEDAQVMVQLVAAGRGVSTFPDWLIDKYRKDAPVSGVRLGEFGIGKELYLVFRQQDLDIPYFRGFIEDSSVHP